MRSLFAILALLALSGASTLAVAADEEEKPPVDVGYFAMKPSIVSNLSGGPKYIRCDIQLMTEQAAEIPTLELHSAALRHAILMLIAGQDGKQLQTREGKEGLRKEALQAMQTQLEELTGNPIVNDLYFTAYYVK